MHSRANRPGQFLHLLALILIAFFSVALTGCHSGATLVDESGDVASGSYWSRTFTTDSNGKMTIELTAAGGSVSCFLMNSTQFATFQSLHSGLGGQFSYLANMSKDFTTSYSNSAMAPAGTYTFVVMTTDYSHAAIIGGHPMQSAHFSVKITGSGVPVPGGGGGGGGTPAPSTPPPSVVNIPPANQLPPRPTPPPPPPLKLTFTNVDDALATLKRGQVPERRAALQYLNQEMLIPTDRVKVVDALLPLLSDPQLGSEASLVVAKSASKENALALHAAVQNLLAGDPNTLNPRNAQTALTLAALLLSYDDADAVDVMVRLMRSPSTRPEARDALEKFGSGAEKDIIALLSSTDRLTTPVTQDCLELLAKIGTEKSIEVMQKLQISRDPLVQRLATDSLNKLADRLQLKPEQYMYNIFNRYVIDAPAGFVPDPAFQQANTHRWIHQAPGRQVKSTYTVEVKYVGPNYHMPLTPPNSSTIQAGSLTFHTLNPPPSPQFTTTAHAVALDGEFLIDITAIVDTNDKTAQPNVSTALQKIHAKAPAANP